MIRIALSLSLMFVAAQGIAGESKKGGGKTINISDPVAQEGWRCCCVPAGAHALEIPTTQAMCFGRRWNRAREGRCLATRSTMKRCSTAGFKTLVTLTHYRLQWDASAEVCRTTELGEKEIEVAECDGDLCETPGGDAL